MSSTGMHMVCVAVAYAWVVVAVRWTRLVSDWLWPVLVKAQQVQGICLVLAWVWPTLSQCSGYGPNWSGRGWQWASWG